MRVLGSRGLIDKTVAAGVLPICKTSLRSTNPRPARRPPGPRFVAAGWSKQLPGSIHPSHQGTHIMLRTDILIQWRQSCRFSFSGDLLKPSRLPIHLWSTCGATPCRQHSTDPPIPTSPKHTLTHMFALSRTNIPPTSPGSGWRGVHALAVQHQYHATVAGCAAFGAEHHHFCGACLPNQGLMGLQSAGGA